MPAIVRTLGYSFSLSCYRDHRDLHSFPTRRSSDLAAASSLGGPVVVKAQVLTGGRGKAGGVKLAEDPADARSEEHTSELQSLTNLVCRLLLEKKKRRRNQPPDPDLCGRADARVADL